MTHNPPFCLVYLDDGISEKFVKWLCISCGGEKTEKEAKQAGKRTMKFFMQALGNNENETDLTYEFDRFGS